MDPNAIEEEAKKKMELMRERLSNEDWVKNHPGLKIMYEKFLKEPPE